MGTILVIDDDKVILLMLSTLLANYGFKVETSADGWEGIQKFDHSDFDLVITDICMPGLDGNDVVRYIRRSKKKHTPVVGISGTFWLLENDSFDAVLSKPFSMKNLVDTVCRLTETTFH